MAAAGITMDDKTESPFKFIGEAIQCIRVDAKEKNRSSGQIECPKCKGKLGYSIARSNGHVHGRCETSGCLAWMM